MFEVSQFCLNVVGAANRALDRKGREARAERRRRAQTEQSLTVDQLKSMGVVKFRERPTARGDAQETVGYLGDLRFVVGPHGSIKVEGYIDPDKAVSLAQLYR